MGELGCCGRDHNDFGCEWIIWAIVIIFLLNCFCGGAGFGRR